MIGIWIAHFWSYCVNHYADGNNNCFFRARELFYYLKGGRVDFGEEHSEACGHSRFGRDYGKG